MVNDLGRRARSKEHGLVETQRDEARRMQRVAAHGRIAVRQGPGGTRLERLFQEGAAKIRLPRRQGHDLEAVLINTAGGLTGGDRLEWEAQVDDGAALTLTTQACEKVYRAGEGEARVTCRLRAGKDAFIAWLPQETILFDRSALRRRLEIDLAPGARALILEATIFGRTAMGEEVRQAVFRDRWRVRVNGRLVHAEDLALDGAVADTLRLPASGAGARAMATVLMMGEGVEAFATGIGDMLAPTGGASAWAVGDTGKLLARLTATDGHALRQRLIPLLQMLSGEAGLPRIWSS
jgi:urease accessory protein